MTGNNTIIKVETSKKEITEKRRSPLLKSDATPIT